MGGAAFSSGCFGKLPLAADFLQHQAAGPAARAFMNWCEMGVRLLAERHGSAAETLLTNMPPLGFVFSETRPSEFLVGRMVAGRDASGRRFPFSIFLRGSGMKSVSFGALAGACGPFFAEADRILAADSSAPAALFAAIDALPAQAPDGRKVDRGALEDYLGRMPVSSTAAMEPAAQNLARLVSRGRQLPPMALRFPLQPDAPAEPWVAFWLGLVEEAFGRTAVATAFWTVDSRAPAVETGAGGSEPRAAEAGTRLTAPGARLAHLDLMAGPPEPIAFLHLIDSGFESNRLMILGDGSAEGGRKPASGGQEGSQRAAGGGEAEARPLLEPAQDLAEVWKGAVARLGAGR